MRLLRVSLVLGLLAAMSACGNGDDTAKSTAAPDPATPSSTTITPGLPDTTEPEVTVGPASTAPVSTSVPATDPDLVDVRIYLLRDERLAVTHREVEGPAVLRNALVALLEGPTESERAAGLHTEIPDGTTLRDVNLASGLATVDLSADYEPAAARSR